jgi:hypothetical protein
MTDEQIGFGDPQELYFSWMKTVGDFWQGAFKAWNSQPEAATSSTEKKASQSPRFKDGLNKSMRAFQAAAAGMSEPEVLQSLFKGAGAMPDILARLAQSSLTGFLQVQHKLFESAGRIGKTAEAYQFEELDENIFRTWADLYEKEFKQFLNIPQLGLTRFYQEKGNQVLDKYMVFQNTLGEFSRLLTLPVHRSFAVLQEEIGLLAEKGELPEEGKVYYGMWIKILEGHYMTLFQSPEYIQSLGETLATLSDFTRARDDLIEDFLGTLPIPRQKEVDELYKEIYLLKKRIKALEKKRGGR